MKTYGLLGCLVLSAVLALPARAEVAPRVFISEINWAGSQVSTADEWFELVNLDTVAADLSGWVITGAGTGGGAIQIADGTVLAPHSILLIANYGLNDPKTTLNVTPDLTTAAVSLPNSNLHLILATASGLVVDEINDSSSPDFGLAQPTTSMERNLTTLAWQSATTSTGLLNATQFGTPGRADYPLAEVSSTPVETPPMETPVPETQLPPLNEEVVPEQLCPAPVVTPITSSTCQAPEPTADPATNTILTPNPTPNPEVSNHPDVTTPDDTIPAESAPEAVLPNSAPTETTPVSTPVDTLSVQIIAPGELVINEFVSDPTDSTEWVEVKNTTDHDIDLTGVTLTDASGKVTPLPAQALAAHSFIRLDNPNGKLNNDGDTLTLTNSLGQSIDGLTYGTDQIPAPKDGESAARDTDGAWHITQTPTPLADNPNSLLENSTTPETTDNSPTLPETYEPVLTNPTTDTPTNDTHAPNNNPGAIQEALGETVTHQVIAIAQPIAKTTTTTKATGTINKKGNDLIEISGTVVALPGTFGKQTMFVDGHEIYFNAAKWPTLTLGDVVTLKGTMGTSGGNDRLKIASAENIVVTRHTALTPRVVTGTEFKTAVHGNLVTVTGEVTSKKGTELTLATTDGQAIVVIANKANGITWDKMTSGTATITGLVRVSADTQRLYVRSAADVVFTPTESAATPTKAAPKKSAPATTPWVGGGLLTGSLGALGTWFLKSRKGLLAFLPF